VTESIPIVFCVGWRLAPGLGAKAGSVWQQEQKSFLISGPPHLGLACWRLLFFPAGLHVDQESDMAKGRARVLIAL
jgi:hypothetical protein